MASWSRAERGPGRVLGAGGAGFRAGLRSWLALWAWAWAWSTGEPVAPPPPRTSYRSPGRRGLGRLLWRGPAPALCASAGTASKPGREVSSGARWRPAPRGPGRAAGSTAGARAGRAAGGVPRAGTALRCRAPRTETVIRASPPYGHRGTQGAVPGDADTQRSGGSRVWTPAWETRFPGRRAA